ncbi:MAG: tail fiber domain-containing protein [Limisphaerales bacterium]
MKTQNSDTQHPTPGHCPVPVAAARQSAAILPSSHRHFPKRRYVLAVGLLLSAFCFSATAQTSAFTYQGRLDDGGAPANGRYDFIVTDFDALTGGYSTTFNLVTNIGVTNGLFTLALDLTALTFPGADRWLELAVRTNGGGSFTTLSPRQRVTSAPYAIRAASAGTVAASGITGTLAPAQLPAAVVTNAATGVNLTGTFSGNGAGLTNLPAWRLGGNAGTTPGVNFLGTTDNQPLEVRVNNLRVLRLEPTANAVSLTNAVNLIAGSLANSIGPGVFGATIAGGGAVYYQGDPSTNLVEASFGTVAGGFGNSIRASAGAATISGGGGNSIHQFSEASTIGGGLNNEIRDSAYWSIIAGGLSNTNESIASVISGGQRNRIGKGSFSTFGHSTIGGGAGNTIHSNAYYARIGSGAGNTIQPNNIYANIGGGEGNTIQSSSATIGGGSVNTIQANASYATISGGGGNTIQTNASFATIGGSTNRADGQYATIPGGLLNTATNYAFAAGRRAKAIHTGGFVWADSTDADFSSTTSNQFNIRATGGVRISDNTPGLFFGNTTRQMLNLWSTNFGIGVQDSTTYFRTDSGFAWYRAGSHTNSGPGTGGTTLMTLTASGLTVNGTFVSASDRNVKADFRPVNPAQVLDKVLALPLQEWIYQADPKRSRHLGPMAQDFHAAFGLGQDDTSIATVDADGVALAAIQGLNQKVESREQKTEMEMAELRAENAALKARLEKLEQLLSQQLNPKTP